MFEIDNFKIFQNQNLKLTLEKRYSVSFVKLYYRFIYHIFTEY
jgi:hypothetical protein